MIQRTRRITKLAAQAEINLIAISTLQIHMWAKEEERKAPKSSVERKSFPRLSRGKRKLQRLPKDAEGERKR